MSHSEEARLSPPVGAADHARGPAEAPVTLVEYGDFECPYCGRAYPIVKELERQLGDRIRVIFRNFPLTNLHPHAQAAAEAAEAAGSQGRFWEMHDEIFEHQEDLEPADLVAYAKQVGLDVERFRHDQGHHRWAERVREHFMSGVRSGVNGTPTFFMNGHRHDGGYGFDELVRAIERAAERAGAAAGVEPT